LADPAGHRGGGGRPLDPAAVPVRRLAPQPRRGHQLPADRERHQGGGAAGLVAGLAGLLMYLVLTGAITRAVAAEVTGEDPSVEQSYRFGFHRLGSVLLVSVLVGLATIAGFIL